MVECELPYSRCVLSFLIDPLGFPFRQRHAPIAWRPLLVDVDADGAPNAIRWAVTTKPGGSVGKFDTVTTELFGFLTMEPATVAAFAGAARRRRWSRPALAGVAPGANARAELRAAPRAEGEAARPGPRVLCCACLGRAQKVEDRQGPRGQRIRGVCSCAQARHSHSEQSQQTVTGF